MYNYIEEMVADISDYVEENSDRYQGLDRDELERKLQDDLWAEDSVTGNGSGSYTFDSDKAAEYVIGNEDYAKEAVSDFGIEGEEVAKHLFDYEYWDVTIRCYLLGQAIAEYLDNNGTIGGVTDSARRRIKAKLARVRDARNRMRKANAKAGKGRVIRDSKRRVARKASRR